MNGEQIENQLMAALRDLAAGDVADTLREAGIAGTPRDPNRCPIAQWVKSLRPSSDWEVVVSEQEIIVFAPVFSRGHTIMETPATVGAFIRKFDDGGYPYLITWSD